MASYLIRRIDLSKKVTKQIIPGSRGMPISKLTVRRMPVGANIELHYGDGGEAIPLITQGERFALCPPEVNGLFVTVPVAQSGEVVLLVSSAEGEVDSLGVGVPGGGDFRVPIDPWHGYVETPGSLNSPPHIRLFNPVGSGRLYLVRRLRIAINDGVTVIARRTATPMGLDGGGATIFTPLLQQMDERSTRSITADFKGTTFPSGTPPASVAQVQWVDVSTNSKGMEVVTGFPWTIKEGSAVEVRGVVNGAGNVARAYAVVDEL